jgi:nucleolysin TIA-1/TIAR
MVSFHSGWFKFYATRLTYSEKPDAEQAIATMNGEWLGSRAIRVNWANQKTQTGTGVGGGGPPMPPARSWSNAGGGISPAPMSMGHSGAFSPASSAPSYSTPTYSASSYSVPGGGSYDNIATQASEQNTTVYVGNLIPYTTQADLIPLFQGYGYIVEIRMQADRGFAFVKLDTHQNATLAITHLQNQLVHGRPIKCSWGKDKEGGSSVAPQAAPAAQYPAVRLLNLLAFNILTLADGIPWFRLLRQLLASTRCSRSTRWCGAARSSRCISRSWRMGLSSGSSLLFARTGMG